MTVRERFEYYFSEEYLRLLYLTKIRFTSATGIDHLRQKQFSLRLDKELKIINRKILNNEYKFSKFKQKLISKGPGKAPREISIPTIRDRIVLRALCNFLMERYRNVVNLSLPQRTIESVKEKIESEEYSGFVKLDIEQFYPSINHEILLRRINRKHGKNKYVTDLIEKIVKTPTVSKSRKDDEPTEKGIPQGLSVSNILASIYLVNIDKNISNLDGMSYFRYVDDICILCEKNDIEEIIKNRIKEFKALKLKVYDPKKNPEKSTCGDIYSKFSFLGYVFKEKKIRPRDSSIEKLKESLVAIFTSYMYSNIKNKGFLQWRLNLRVTGCIYENKCKGWLFYYSKINDLSLLHLLDNNIEKLKIRFGLREVKVKRFVRSYFEIQHSKYETKYIPNFDKYNLNQKKDVLKDYFKLKRVDRMSNDEIELQFKKRIDKHVRDLLTDVQDFRS